MNGLERGEQTISHGSSLFDGANSGAAVSASLPIFGRELDLLEATSARSRASSICSGLTGFVPAPASLPSRSAFTQLYSVCSTTPSVAATAAMLCPDFTTFGGKLSIGGRISAVPGLLRKSARAGGPRAPTMKQSKLSICDIMTKINSTHSEVTTSTRQTGGHTGPSNPATPRGQPLARNTPPASLNGLLEKHPRELSFSEAKEMEQAGTTAGVSAIYEGEGDKAVDRAANSARGKVRLSISTQKLSELGRRAAQSEGAPVAGPARRGVKKQILAVETERGKKRAEKSDRRLAEAEWRIGGELKDWKSEAKKFVEREKEKYEKLSEKEIGHMSEKQLEKPYAQLLDLNSESNLEERLEQKYQKPLSKEELDKEFSETPRLSGGADKSSGTISELGSQRQQAIASGTNRRKELTEQAADIDSIVKKLPAGQQRVDALRKMRTRYDIEAQPRDKV
jgi:hypothetical protein